MEIFKETPGGEKLLSSVFIYPTETCYGMGCDALNHNLVERIYKIKQRDTSKPVSWLVSSIDMAEEYVIMSACAKELAEKYWPGALTLVLPVKMPDISGFTSIAVRVSSHPLANSLVQRLDRPLVSTSANISGNAECYSVAAVIGQLGKKQLQPDFIIDGGDLPPRLPSTIVEVVGDQIKVLREGEVNF